MSRVYDLRAWHRVRKAHMVAEPLCQHCARGGLTVPAQHVDHIVPISKGGAWFDYDNLQSLCKPCHDLKTGRDEGWNVRLGCSADGVPTDRDHHWNKG